MPTNGDEEEIAHLRELNEELSESLDRCRAILKDCRSKLAANSNEQQLLLPEEDTGSG